MTWRLLWKSVSILALATLGVTQPAHAVGPEADVAPNGPDFVVSGEEKRPKTGADTTASSSVQAADRLLYVPACLVGGTAVCDTVRRCSGDGVLHHVYVIESDGSRLFWGQVCLGGDTQSSPAAPREVTNAMVLRALRRVEVPVPSLMVQPPGGKTLVNLETIFSTSAEPFTASVELVGRQVDLRVEPVGYLWTHGDGSSQRTTEPGRTYAEGVAMSNYLTHVYSDAGVTVHPSVAVEYGASFRVDGGPWRAVVGTVTVQGEPVALRVVEATPVLVTPP
ncbi:hypothetical protein [Nocardioides alcanivorans]|uniref:hypothetical protein n=1 Tax=Nocardioides alcanivorans TaxID=2897352 RepID=UPI001F3FAB79|nr:hypothetical protein [Nocardioides alcanivorans]